MLHSDWSVKYVSKSGALCPLPSWQMGLWRSNHTTECCENKNKKQKNNSYYIHLSVRNGKQARVQCSQTDERCSCPDLGWWVFSTLLLSFLREGFSSLPGEVSWARSCGCCWEQQSQTHHWCSSTKAPSLTEGTNLALCILNKLLTLLGMKKWLLKSLPPHTNANDSRRTREC